MGVGGMEGRGREEREGRKETKLVNTPSMYMLTEGSVLYLADATTPLQTKHINGPLFAAHTK